MRRDTRPMPIVPPPRRPEPPVSWHHSHYRPAPKRPGPVMTALIVILSILTPLIFMIAVLLPNLT
jgi:hypothetical protein